MAGLGDQKLHIGVQDVASQVLPPAGVIETHHHRSHEPRATKREDIVRRVVQEHGDVGRSITVEPGTKKRSESFGLEKKISVSPDPVAKSKRRTIGRASGEGVAPQEVGDVPGGQGHLAEGRGELDTFGHFRGLPPAPSGVAA